MAAYLTGKQLGTQQWYAKRNRPLTGCTVLHTSEGVLDSVGPDTGAEGLAEFIRTRTTAGSYHAIADSDSWIHLVEWDHGAFHDGTGSNNWALSLSFACRTTDWRTMSPAKRAGFLRQGAKAFLAQQAYRRSIGAPLTELRLITKAQSDAGVSGFTYHGLRDPGRRSDPGVAAPNLFPFDEFIAAIRAEQGDPTEEDFMASMSEDEKKVLMSAAARINGFLVQRYDDKKMPARALDSLDGNYLVQLITGGTDRTLQEFRQEAERDAASHAALLAAVQGGDPEVIADAVVAALPGDLGEQVVAAMGRKLS